MTSFFLQKTPMTFHRFICLTICMLAFACSKPEDNLNPLLQTVQPEEGETLLSGSTNDNVYFLQDDMGISQLKRAITTGTGFTLADSLVVKAFENINIVEIGMEDSSLFSTQDIFLEIPDSIAAGAYRMVSTVLDFQGNESEPDTVNFFILNQWDTVVPYIQINAPTISSQVSLSQDSILEIDLVCSDDQQLMTVEIDISNPDNESILSEISMEISSTAFQYNTSITMDSTWALGNYTLLVKSFDWVNNLTTNEVVFEIVQ